MKYLIKVNEHPSGSDYAVITLSDGNVEESISIYLTYVFEHVLESDREWFLTEVVNKSIVPKFKTSIIVNEFGLDNILKLKNIYQK